MAKKPEKLFDEDPAQISEANEEIPEWEKGLKKESIGNLVKQPKMYPQLKPRMDAKYRLKILTLPRMVETKEYGEGFVMNVIDKDGNINSLWVGESIKLALAVERRRNNLKANDLLDRWITLQKTQTLKKGRTINVFLVIFD